MEYIITTTVDDDQYIPYLYICHLRDETGYYRQYRDTFILLKH